MCRPFACPALCLPVSAPPAAVADARSSRYVALALALAAPSGLTGQDSVAAIDRYGVVAQRLTAFIEHERAQKGIPAMSIALVEGRRVVWARGFGWADSAANRRATASTVYRVGSVSKLFTDIGIMRLVEQH